MAFYQDEEHCKQTDSFLLLTFVFVWLGWLCHEEGQHM